MCDGKTEKDYFVHLRRMLRNVAALDVRHFKYDLKGFRLPSDDFDEIWCVFDKDDRKNETFDKFIQEANERKWIAGWSNPCFELWLELHFHEVSRHARKQYDQTRRWEQLAEKKFGRKPRKTLDGQLLDELLECFPAAIEHARHLYHQWEKDASLAQHPSRRNPCTMVFLLAERVRALQQSHQ